MDKYSHASEACDEITYPLPNFNGWNLGMDE